MSPQTMKPVPIELVLAQGEVGDARVRPGGRWVSGIETVVHETGVTRRLRMWRVGGDEVVDVMVDPEPAAPRGLSGGVHAWHPSGRHVAVVVRGGGVVVVALEHDRTATVEFLPLDAMRTWSSPEFTADGRELHLSADWTEIVGLDTETLETWVFHDGSDFAIDPAGVAGGASLAWDRPHMAWTQSRIQPHPPRENIAVQQPRRSADGSAFGWIDDERGWWNVVIDADHRSSTATRIDDAAEHGGPTWGPGQRSWCLSPDGSQVAYTRNENGYGSLWVFDRATGTRTQVSLAAHGSLSWEGTTLAAVRSGARTPPQLVAYEITRQPDGSVTATRQILCDSADPAWRRDHDATLVEPEVMQTASGVPWRLYRAPEECGVILWVHGGPTDQWTVTFRARIATWVSRGWSIAVPDHRGTTGHGRIFREALHGEWGRADVDDVAEVLDEIETLWGPRTVVMMGGSAGGLTALGVAAHRPGRVGGVVVSYPVVDLSDMLRHDDPFEGHYMPTLIGTSDPDAPQATVRSPLAHAEALAHTPILVFHGDMDSSVPIVHTERLGKAVRAAGGSIEVVVMPGEGHGFKDAAHLAREHEITEAFLAAVAARPLTR